MIWLLTIRHTGTHYTFKVLESFGFEKALVDITSGAITEGDFVHLHIDEERHKAKEYASSPVIISLRNPVEVFRSFVYRYTWKNQEFINHIITSFQKLDAIIAFHNAYIFQVDAEDQKAEISQLAKFLNVANWTYKEQERNIGTIIKKKPTIQQTLMVADEHRNMLHKNPPSEIFTLATQYGY